MQLKTSSKRTSLVAILTGFVALSPIFLSYFVSKISIHRGLALIIVDTEQKLSTENAVTIPNEEQVLTMQEQVISGLPASPVGEPVRLKIPRINVDSAVEYVGLTVDGAMDVPKEPANTAWFNLGPRPGDNGSAVIAGHYGGKKSVFDNLYKLRKGDKLYIEDDKGSITSFVVRENRRYDPKADTLTVFDSNDGKSHLNLVTCEGEWDERAQQYLQRLVVFTDREI